MSVAGAAFAISRAESRIILGVKSVMLYAHSGVNCRTCSFSSSNPVVYLETYAASYKSSKIMTFIQANNKAISVAGRIGNQYFDLLATVDKRGSTVIMVTPLSMASETSCTCELCIFSPI